MRRIGLVGGTSWVSTASYYRILNEQVRERLGGLHGADVMIRSVDLQTLLDRLDRPAEITDTLARAVDDLVTSGSAVLGYASVTAHSFAPADPRIVHLADSVSGRVEQLGLRRVGVLATGLTRTDTALVARLTGPAEPVWPSLDDQRRLDRIIFDDLMRARAGEAVQTELTMIIDRLRNQGIDAILLACTELCFAVERHGPWPDCHDVARWHCEDLIMAALHAEEVAAR